MFTLNSIGLRVLAVVVLVCHCANAQSSATQPGRLGNSETLMTSALSSSNLTATQVQGLEDRVKANPDDSRSRAALLGYYFLQQSQRPDMVGVRRNQIFWMISNRADDRITGMPFCEIDPTIDREGYLAAKELWKQQLAAHPKSQEVIENAVQFLILPEPKAAEDLLKQAATADPNNAQWHEDLAQLYSRPMPTTEPVDQLALRRLEETEKAFVLTKTPEERFYILTDLPTAAMACGDKVKTTEYAKQLLAQAPGFRRDWNYGNAIHKGNLALGRVALAMGDIETAKARLLDAGKTPGSPQLDSFGPNLELARKLLNKGERDVVLQYLDLCGKFWKSDNGKLDAWRRSIKAGEVPDFGANLAY